MPDSTIHEPIPAASVGRLELQVSNVRDGGPSAFCACIDMHVVCLCFDPE